MKYLGKIKLLLELILLFIALILIIRCFFPKDTIDLVAAIVQLFSVLVAIYLPFYFDHRNNEKNKVKIQSLLATELYVSFKLLNTGPKELTLELSGETKLKENIELFSKVDLELFELYANLRHYIYMWKNEVILRPDKNNRYPFLFGAEEKIEGRYRYIQIQEKKAQIILDFLKFLAIIKKDVFKQLISNKMNNPSEKLETSKDNPEAKLGLLFILLKDGLLQEIKNEKSLSNFLDDVLKRLQKYSENIEIDVFQKIVNKKVN